MSGRRNLRQWLMWSTLTFAMLAVSTHVLGIGDGSDSAATTTVVTTTVPPTTSSYVPREYTVATGDNLYNIAERFNLSAPALVELNKITNPDRVPIGTVLKLPPSAGFVPIGATTTMPP